MNKILNIILIILIIISLSLTFLNIFLSRFPKLQMISGLIFILLIIISLVIPRVLDFKKEIEKQTKSLNLSKQKLKHRISQLEEEGKELEKSLSHMEQWYETTVKRELEMIELKKQLKQRENN